MNTISETLRRERLRQGLDMQKLSDSTKISTRMLQAMEAGDLTKLPGGVFTRSFFKQYASALGIDSAYIDTEVRQLSPDPSPAAVQQQLSFVAYESMERKSNSLVVASMWVVLALVGCGAVYYFAKNYQFPATARPVESAVVKQRPTPEPVRVSQTAIAPAGATVSPATAPPNTGSVQVVLNASEKSWVSVSVDGKLLFSGILQPNERREINAEEKVKVTAGNAGGLDISLNGKNIDSLGPKGQVRTVELTRAGAQVVSRTSKPEPLL